MFSEIIEDCHAHPRPKICDLSSNSSSEKGIYPVSLRLFVSSQSPIKISNLESLRLQEDNIINIHISGGDKIILLCNKIDEHKDDKQDKIEIKFTFSNLSDKQGTIEGDIIFMS